MIRFKKTISFFLGVVMLVTLMPALTYYSFAVDDTSLSLPDITYPSLNSYVKSGEDLKIKWKAVSGLDHYEITFRNYKNLDTADYTLNPIIFDGKSTGKTNSYTIKAKILEAGEQYGISVKAVLKNGKEVWSKNSAIGHIFNTQLKKPTAKSIINDSVILRIDSPYIYNKGSLYALGGKNRNVYPYISNNTIIAPFKNIGKFLGANNGAYQPETMRMTFNNGISVKATEVKNNAAFMPLRKFASAMYKKVYYKDGFIIIGNIPDSGSYKEKYTDIMDEVIEKVKSRMIRIPSVTGLNSVYNEGKVDLNGTIHSPDSKLTKVTIMTDESEDYNDGRFLYEHSINNSTFNLNKWSEISSGSFKDLFKATYNSKSRFRFNIWAETAARPGTSFLIGSYTVNKNPIENNVNPIQNPDQNLNKGLGARSVAQSTLDFIFEGEGCPNENGIAYVYDDAGGWYAKVIFDEEGNPTGRVDGEPITGSLTIGYGTRWYDGMPTSMTVEEAYEKAANDINNNYAKSVLDFMDSYDPPLVFNQNQFDALVSFTYNLGDSWTRNDEELKTLLSTTPYKKEEFIDYFFEPGHEHENGDPPCGKCFYVWTTRLGQKYYLKGLKNRRLSEIERFFTPD